MTAPVSRENDEEAVLREDEDDEDDGSSNKGPTTSGSVQSSALGAGPSTEATTQVLTAVGKVCLYYSSCRTFIDPHLAPQNCTCSAFQPTAPEGVVT